MAIDAKKSSPPATPEPPPLKPRPRLLWVTAVLLAIWIILLLAIYFTVVR